MKRFSDLNHGRILAVLNSRFRFDAMDDGVTVSRFDVLWDGRIAYHGSRTLPILVSEEDGGEYVEWEEDWMPFRLPASGFSEPVDPLLYRI
ncbi:hypothetical protein [Bifidobacterium sp. SO1]|uniref:hypothetical protein n=1 Tax=Bifidobacterium sp. SO1 TaxID=2809029 RepID=UPI001BDCD119|nr:hypothetical protein [Bifidobacterium sp. SO1]MBT1162788.1 hypothetical protein [Bifidobacterium sp. SO1]